VRRILIVIAVIIGVLIAADRITEAIAGNVVAKQVQRSQHLVSKPSVSFGGFPFLTQAIGGRYSRIDVTIKGLHPDGQRIAQVNAHLHGVRIPLGDALSGNVQQIPVDSVTATGRLDYADLTRTIEGVKLTVSPAPNNEVKVSGELSEFGVDIPASALCSVIAQGNQITVSVRSVDVAGISLNPGLTATVADTFGFTRHLPLPFGLHLTGVQSKSNGLEIGAAGSGLVLTR
jgi:hypothetical protein